MKIYINKDGQQLGPYTLAEARALVAAGTVAANDWAWYEGLADWTPLNQIPGYAVPAPAPAPARVAAVPAYVAPAAAVSPAFTAAPVAPARRPVLVWIICIFYFIFSPLGMLVIAATPYLMSFSHASLERADAQLTTALSHTTDPDTQAKLEHAQQQVRDAEANLDRTPGHGVGFIVFAEGMAIICLAAAVCLFLLRRIALWLFVVPFVIGLGYQVYTYFIMGLIHTMNPMQMAITAISAGVGWVITILIILYVWSLHRNGVLR